MRRTKIVGTIGPASSTPDVMSKLIRAGLNVARINCSHAGHAEIADQIENLRRVSRLLGVPIAILLDLCGPKVRTGRLAQGTMTLVAGQRLLVVPGDAPGQDGWITTNHPGLPEDLRPGARLLLDDGLMELRVEKIGPDRVLETEIVVGGLLKERKGMNLPDSLVSIPALTEKDKGDALVGLAEGVDYVALSFVQTAADIVDLKRVMAPARYRVPIIAKIEKPQAIDNIDSILGEVEGIMVARGDLAVEVGSHKVPMMQKELLRRSNRRGTLDIVATQMLESMTKNVRPTRAEASDVANAVLDGCDAVMLSAETASGDHPVEVVKMMDLICREVEPSMGRPDHLQMIDEGGRHPSITVAIVRAAAQIAQTGQFAALVVFTLTGQTARLLSGTYPGVPIFALTPNDATERAMALYRGVVPLRMQFPGDSDQMIAEGERLLVERGFLKSGDTAIVVAGFTELRGVANMVKIVRV